MCTIRAVPYRNIDDSAKLRRLLEAALMIGADVELSVLLRHFVEEACSLVNARYGALGFSTKRAPNSTSSSPSE